MKKTLICSLLSIALAAPVLAGGYGSWNRSYSGHGYDGNGNYYRWYNDGDGYGHGYDGNGNYYRWYNDGN